MSILRRCALLLALAVAPALSVADVTGVTSVGNSGEFTCVVTQGGAARCWGWNGNGNLGDGTTLNRALPVTPVGLGTGVSRIATSSAHACAILADGTAKCWGDNFAGALGNGTNVDSPVPVAVAGLTGLADIGVGGSYGCALTDAGGVKCWGVNWGGRLGNGSTAGASYTPVDVQGLSSGVKSMSVGGGHTCVVTAAGGVKCWGEGSYGRLGNGLTTESNVPVGVVGLDNGVKAVSAGGAHTCALLEAGTVKCWGLNSDGQLGDGSDITLAANFQKPTPVDVVGLGTVAAISASDGYNTCALQTNGQVKCWGVNKYYGMLGDGTVDFVSRSTPSTVVGLGSESVTSLHVGGTHACVVVSGGRLRCWGDNEQGQLGTAVRRGSVPAPAPGVPDYQLAAGISHNLMLNARGEVWGWGDNTAGKLGNGTATSSAVPVQAGNLTGVVAVAAGMGHSLALRSDGTVWAWGLNSDGQLGIGATSPATCTVPNDGTYGCALAPVQVGGLTDVIAIAAGWRHSLALLSDGTVRQWGNQNQGTVPGAGQTVPTPVTGFGNPVKRIAAGYMHSVAINATNEVYAWGRGDLGELGPLKPSQNSASPVRVSNVYAYDIVAGGGFTVAIGREGGLTTWGSNAYGALGDPSVPTSDGFGSAGSSATPIGLSSMTDASLVSAGFGFVIARKQDGTAWAWGLNSSGQLGGAAATSLCGTSSPANRPCAKSPMPASAHDGAMVVSAGGAHAGVVRPGGNLVLFGDNARGQLGNTSGNYRAAFSQTTYDPDFTRTPAGAFGSPSGVGTGSTTGSLNADTIGDGLAFGQQNIATTSAAVQVNLSNLSTSSTIAITSIAAAGVAEAAEFAVSSSTCPISPSTLAIGGSCNINLVFRPSAAGTREGTLTVVSNTANSSTLTLNLSGTGVDPREPTSVALGASAASSLQGSAVTFTATVTASGATPAGTVTFKDGGVNIVGCVGRTLAGGNATCPTSALAAGVHAITAEYAGDTNTLPAVSTSLTHTVFVPVALTVSKLGSGTGTVTSSPAGIDCGSTCSANFASGTSVTLSAVAAAGSVFAGWSGGGCSGTAACTVSPSAATTVTATFNLLPTSSALTVAKAGSGTGIVTSAPAGINCGTTCAANFGTGSAVVLTATADAGSAFAGWSGSGCSGTSACAVTMNAAAAVTANFTSTASAYTVLPASLNFGGQSMQTTSPSQAVTITFSGNPTFNLNSLTPSAGFRVTSYSCGALPTSIISAGSCTVTLAFTPEVEGVVNGTLTIGTTAGNQTVALTGVGERSLVTHYYRSILRRAPDDGGKAFWNAEAARVQLLGVNVNEVWFAMAQQFYTSAEYLVFGRDNTGFVTDLFNTFFNRAPDAEGLAYWKGQLDAGLPREVALAAFMFSTEFANFTNAIFGNSSVRAEIDMVTDFYRGILSRLPDDGGFTFWRDRFRAAQCSGSNPGDAVNAAANDISGLFTGSQEFANRGRNNSQYIGDLYNAFLRRGGDLGGVQFWIAQVTGSPPPQTREAVRLAFVSSPEFQKRVVAIINQGCLR